MEDFIVNYSDPQVWDQYIASHAGPDGGLLQSWAWGEVQRKFGRRVRRLAARGGGKLVSGWQMIEHRLPFSQRYWYVPRPVEEQGAITANGGIPPSYIQQKSGGGRSKEQGLFIGGVITQARKERAIFLRVDGGQNSQLQNFGFRKVAGSVQPPEELLMDVTRKSEVLFSAMKPKTRYNIRLAEKHGVQVSEALFDENGFSIFFALIQATAFRQKIRAHPEPYYRAMFEEFRNAGNGRLLVARFRGQPLAVALVVAFNRVLTYLHGGSSDDHGEVMAPHLLHWHGIQLAQELGCRVYNFGGVSTTDAAWAGLTRFKQGFAPDTRFVQYGGAWERPVRLGWYRMYRIAGKLRKYDMRCRI